MIVRLHKWPNCRSVTGRYALCLHLARRDGRQHEKEGEETQHDGWKPTSADVRPATCLAQLQRNYQPQRLVPYSQNSEQCQRLEKLVPSLDRFPARFLPIVGTVAHQAQCKF